MMNHTKAFLILSIGLGAISPAKGQDLDPCHKLDCFSIVVGRNASADGSVIVAHNEDTGTEIVNYYKVAPRDHESGEEVVFETGLFRPFGHLSRKKSFGNRNGLKRRSL